MNTQNSIILTVDQVKKHYPVSKKSLFSRTAQVVKAVDDVSFEVYRGETFGIVGESGCGKSTLCKTLLRLIEPTEGTILFNDTNISDLSKEEMRQVRQKMQIIFQDPYASLNPRMTVSELIQEPLNIFSLETEQEKREKVRALMQLVGLDRAFVNKYPHEFSGGQRQRIMIARALILNPELLFCDEPVSALDVSVRAQVLNLMKTLQGQLNLTYIFISHDLSVVRYLCDRVAVMYLGRIVELASKEDLYDRPCHPYTKSLLASIPIPDPSVTSKRQVLEGEVPSPRNPPLGCHFHTRCPHTMDICTKEYPQFRKIRKDHFASCHLFNMDKEN